MFEECELYHYNGLYLGKDETEKLNIKKIDGIGLIALMQDYSDVFGMDNNGEPVTVDKMTLQYNALKYNQEFCYIVRNKSLILPPIEIHYGIKKDNQLLAFWEDKKVRDAKLVDVKMYGVQSIIEDMSNSQSVVDDYKKQVQLRKVYNSLTFKI